MSQSLRQSVSYLVSQTVSQSLQHASKLEGRYVGTQSAVSRVWNGESVASEMVGQSYHF